jgi:acyl-CoA oxidase
MVPKSENSEELINHGPQPFIVQIRDMKTHKPLPGIAVGDIGPKYGYASMDNGYALFDGFKVPHSAMLSRYSMVDPNTCTYSKPANPAVVYGSLTAVRAKIVMRARMVLARAVTIAVRYTAIRRQFSDRDDSSTKAPELAVLDYRKWWHCPWSTRLFWRRMLTYVLISDRTNPYTTFACHSFCFALHWICHAKIVREHTSRYFQG